LAAGGHCPYSLAVGSRPWRSGRGRALPLRPHRRRASPYGLAAGDRPLRAPRCKRSCPQALAAPMGAALHVAVPASACHACGLATAVHACDLAANDHPLCRGPWPQPIVVYRGPGPQPAAPLQVAWPWPAAPAGGMAVASRPSSSLRLL
ncbi:hypothetical protein GW17_00051861, partial [Ensete ventricosum]